MARNLVRASAPNIDIGDIVGARFDYTLDWSFLCFIRQTDSSSTNESNFFSKQDTGATRQCRMRVNNGTAPQELEIYMEGSERVTGPDSVELNTWYLIALTNNGGGVQDDFKLYQTEMDGTFVASYGPALGRHWGNIGDLTATLRYGDDRTDTDDAPWDGDLAFGAYFTFEMTSLQILTYLRFPRRFAMNHRTSCEFFHPLGEDDGTNELDRSGNQNNGVMTNVGAIVAGPPSVSALDWPVWVGDAPLAAAAAAAALLEKPLIHSFALTRAVSY